jgi:hypothetical protein
MLKIFKQKQNNNDYLSNNHYKNEQNFKTLNKLDKHEYKNLIFYPSSTKE